MDCRAAGPGDSVAVREGGGSSLGRRPARMLCRPELKGGWRLAPGVSLALTSRVRMTGRGRLASCVTARSHLLTDHAGRRSPETNIGLWTEVGGLGGKVARQGSRDAAFTAVLDAVNGLRTGRSPPNVVQAHDTTQLPRTRQVASWLARRWVSSHCLRRPSHQSATYTISPTRYHGRGVVMSHSFPELILALVRPCA